MLKNAKTDDERLFFLGHDLERIRGTYFRQAMFGEFELATHDLVDKGEALTGSRFTEIYGDLLRRYHGHDQGVLKIDDLYTVEWAYIPHFYYNFYVYQYATSIAGGSLLASDIIEGKPGAAERYLGLLQAGSSKYPYELLKDAGVDLATPKPYQTLIARMNRVMPDSASMWASLQIPRSCGLIRPSAVTAAASVKINPAPPTAREPRCTACH